MIDEILKYFPSISDKQIDRFIRIETIYREWNSKINVISRKDFENFYTHHVLHSLAIAKIINFEKDTRILDVGTGGGFPGIPLSIIYPGSSFFLLDSIEKKITVVNAVISALGLTNATAIRRRAEEETGKYDFIVCRAVTDFQSFVKLTEKNIDPGNRNSLSNGFIFLKGGDLTKELGKYKSRITIWEIKNLFEGPFFETKKIIYLPV